MITLGGNRWYIYGKWYANGEERKMTAPDPNQAGNVGSPPAPSHEQFQNLRKEYQEHIQKEKEHQQRLDEFWDKKKEVLEDGKDSAPELASAELRRIDALRERERELEARWEKAVARDNHELERMAETRRKNRDEGRKLMYDLFKHLTTLGTGSILILGALSNNLLQNASYMGLVPVVFVLLFIAVMFALAYMYSIGEVFLTSERLEPSEVPERGLVPWLLNHIGYVFLITLSLFGFGFLLFVLFATVNLLS